MNDNVLKPQCCAARANIDHLDPTEIAHLCQANTIVADPKRQRPRYFDGRLLTASDLTREQTYLGQRLADLAHAATPGVIYGLDVSKTGDTILRVSRGNGVTPAGALVVLTENIDVDLADVAEIQRLDAAFDLDYIPNEPARRRTGLFVLALRPVEFTANPTTSYPTSITERRTAEDGEIIEAVAVTLVPYPGDQAEHSAGQPRAQVARKLFVERASGGVPQEALPIAMVQLERGFVVWVDTYMVRREVGPEHGGIGSFGTISRALREAQVHQYTRHLEDVITERRKNGLNRPRFAASEFFRALPSTGKMPIETIDRKGVRIYTQLYFPAQVQVLMALVPEDEVAAAVEESMLLPPIDLTATADELGFTWILILLPAPRSDLFVAQLTRAVELAPATPGIVTRGTQLNAFAKFLPHALPIVASDASPTESNAYEHEEVLRRTFERAQQRGDRLWYVRRRALRVMPQRHYEVQSVDVGYVKGTPQ